VRNAGKADLYICAKGFACDVAKEGITANCLIPGRIHSQQTDRCMHLTEKNQQAFAAGEYSDGLFWRSAHAVAFPCSPKARRQVNACISTAACIGRCRGRTARSGCAA